MMEKAIHRKKAVIIGAGPAGITAASELAKTNNFTVAMIERDGEVGGLSRTTRYKGCSFDIGPHHFLSESTTVLQWWHDLMGSDFIPHKRFTRIFYKKHFFIYPLQPLNALWGLNPFESFRCILSYIKIRLFPIKKVRSLQDFFTNRFGYRLFSIFFKNYTEKLWGIPCDQISADWADARIRNFSLSKAIFYAFFGRFFRKNKPRTIQDSFFYPVNGAGTLWQKAADQALASPHVQLKLNQEVVLIEHDNQRIINVQTKHTDKIGVVHKLETYPVDYLFSTMSLRSLISSLVPAAPSEVVKAAKTLRYRGIITVNFIVNKQQVSPDHWIYIHEKDVMSIRLDNMNNFSLKMVDDPTKHTAISLEHFAFVEDSFWKKSDKELIALGRQEIDKIGLFSADLIVDGIVLREAEAYPVYDEQYKQHVNIVLSYLARFSNLQLMGRNGKHQYNNMDVAMLSAFDAVQNVLKDVPREMPVHKASKQASSHI